MRKNVKKIIKRILSLLEEAESYEFHKKNLINSADSLFRDYQEGKYSHAEYSKLLDDVLKRRTKEEWINYYDSYVYSIMKQLEPLLSQIIYFVYNDDSMPKLYVEKEGFAEVKHTKTKLPEIEEDKRHELRKIKEKEAAQFVEFEREPLMGRQPSPVRERFEEEIGRIRKDRERKQPGRIDVTMPERKERRPSAISRFLIWAGHLSEKRRLRKKKEHIRRKLDRIKEPSIPERLKGILRRMKPEVRKEPKPVVVKEPSLFARLGERIRSPFRQRERLEWKKPAKKPVAVRETKERKERRAGIGMMARIKGIFSSGKPAFRMPEPSKPKKTAKETFVAKEDRELDRLVTGLEQIDRGVTELKVKAPKMSLRMKLDLFLIRLHTSGRRRKAAAREKVTVKEMPEEKPVEMAVPKVSEKRVSVLERMQQGISGSIEAIKSRIFVPVEKAEAPAEKPKAAKAEAAAPAREAKEKEEIKFRFSWSAIREWYRKMMAEEKRFVSKKDTMTSSLQMQALKEKVRVISEEERITPKLLKEEVESIQRIISEGKKFKVYQPSFIGSFANATIRKFTFYLIEQYPTFFKTLYDNLRLANIKVLSNTYVNIMILTTIVISALSSIFFFAFFLFTNNPLFMVVPKTLVMVMLAGGVTFLLFYSYPQMKAKTREKSINTNLPFAINHISAVSGSGVPPTRMFKLIMESEEYGEIAVEIEKIVEYVELFGYDLLTAVRSVALTSPSVPFKEFLEGMVSTIESGGDISVYLREKTSEAMLSYELERQKYTETISTYSDIYTGILIAAPLFFIVALSLVSMLGGTIGGLDVTTVIVFGAYVIIPVLNIIFIIILELTQPEV